MTGRKHPNHRVYLQTLRRMTADERLRKAFELGEFSKQLFINGLRRRFPELTEDQLRRLLHRRLDKCHNRTY